MAKKSVEPTKVNRTWEEKIILYDFDYNLNTSYFKVRFKLKEGTENYLIPITPLLQARLVDTVEVKVPSRGDLELRQLKLCYLNPSNKTGKTEITVVVPYSPEKPEWKEQIKETFDYSDAITITYKGESKNTEYVTPIN